MVAIDMMFSCKLLKLVSLTKGIKKLVFRVLIKENNITNDQLLIYLNYFHITCIDYK